MEPTATGLIVIGWKLALALIAGTSILTTVGVYILARFTHVFDAYAGERAKLLAQFHNLDKLVEQTKTLTATAETIKARISDELWDRQMRWTAKRDMYIKLAECISNLIGAEATLLFLEEAKKDSQIQLRDVKEHLEQLTRLTAVAPLLLSDRSTKILRNLGKHTAEKLWAKEHIDSLKVHLEILRLEARKDLGYDELGDDSIPSADSPSV